MVRLKVEFRCDHQCLIFPVGPVRNDGGDVVVAVDADAAVEDDNNPAQVGNEDRVGGDDEIDLDAASNSDSTSIENVESQRLEAERQRQLLCAKRSLETNMFLYSITVLNALVLILIPKREFYTVFTFSIIKGSMPLLTTVANFGTIRKVIKQYFGRAEDQEQKE